MATVFESSCLSNRLYRIGERYEESANTFGKCDYTSYSYIVWSVILFVIGATITIFSLDDIVGDHTLFNLGRMWCIGPVLICFGLSMAVKCMLYLRRKSVIQMIFHQPQLFRNLQEPSGTRDTEPNDIQTPQRINIQSIDTENPQHIDIQNPPSYDEIFNELFPPTYAEAMVLGRSIKTNSTTVHHY